MKPKLQDVPTDKNSNSSNHPIPDRPPSWSSHLGQLERGARVVVVESVWTDYVAFTSFHKAFKLLDLEPAKRGCGWRVFLFLNGSSGVCAPYLL
jgi:hypothetical protein